MKYLKKSIAILTAFMLTASVNIMSFAEENSEEYYPKVTLGANVKEEGLHIITSFTPTIKGGREGLMSGEKAGGGNPEYINVDVDDDYMYDAPNFTAVEVTVEYFDDENGKFNLTYNTNNPEVGKFIADNDRYGGSTLIVNLTGTQEWLTHTFYLEDARFANMLSAGTDFRVGIWSPSMGSTNGAVTFGSISVKKVPIRDIFKYNGLTSDKLGNIFTNTDEIKVYNNLQVKTNDNVSSLLKSEVYDANKKLLYEKEQEVKFGPGEEKKVETIFENPKTFGIYTVITTIKSKIDETGQEFTDTYTDEFSICDVVSDEDGNPMIGYCSQVFHGKGTPEDTPGLIMQAGGTWIRIDGVAWNELERSKGVYTFPPEAKVWAQEMKDRGINITGIFKGRVSFYDDGHNPSSPEAIAAFAKYAAYLANELKGLVDSWEVWNEWNIQNFNPSLEPPEVYAEVLKAVYTEVKKVNPDALIIGLDTAGMPNEKASPSVYDWVKRVFAAGAYDYLDAVSGHYYDFGKEGVDEVQLIKSAQTLREIMSEYGPPKPIIISEIGASTATVEGSTSPLDQPGALALYYGVLRAYGLADRMTYYCFYDRADDSDPEASWGSLYCWQYDYNTNPEAKRVANGAKPAYLAMAAMNNFVGATADFEQVIEKDRTYAMKYYNKKMGSRVVTAIAGYTGEQEGKSVCYNFGTNHIEVYDMYGNKVSDLSSDNGTYTFYVNRQPIYIVGDINNFELAEEGSAIVSSDKGEKSSIAGDIVEFTYTKTTDEELTISCDLPDTAELVEQPMFIGNTAKIRIRILRNEGDVRFKVNVFSASGALVYSQNHKIVLGDPVNVEITSGQFIHNSNHWRAEVKVKSLCDSLTMTGSVNITAPEEMLPTAIERNFVLAPGQEIVFYYPIPEKTIQNVMNVTAVVNCDNGEVITKDAALDFTSAAYTSNPPKIDGIIEQGEWNSVWVGADTKKDVMQITDWRGPKDLSFGGAIEWDENNLYLAAVVTDDYHSVIYTPSGPKNMWRGDGIQLGIDDHAEINNMDKVRFTEIAIGDLPGEGDTVVRYKSAYELPVNVYVDKAKLAIKRMDGYTVYELAIPWTELFYDGYVPDPDKAYHFSLMANDNDGNGRRGWIEYCSGIGTHKDVTLFGTMNLLR
ncbi:MAG: hypothetical protein J5590_08790 [Clostridia bacterium]|nr:hypothetical protein [Clostridia bacterium]